MTRAPHRPANNYIKIALRLSSLGSNLIIKCSIPHALPFATLDIL